MKRKPSRVTHRVGTRSKRKAKPVIKKPSGHQFRKLRREKMEAAAKAAGITSAAVLIPRIDDIETVSDWHRELRKLYVRSSIGEIRQYEAEFLRKIVDSGVSACEKKEAREEQRRALDLFERAVDRGVMPREALPLMFNPTKEESPSARKRGTTINAGG